MKKNATCCYPDVSYAKPDKIRHNIRFSSDMDGSQTLPCAPLKLVTNANQIKVKFPIKMSDDKPMDHHYPLSVECIRVFASVLSKQGRREVSIP